MTDSIEWNEEEREALGAYRQALSPTNVQVQAALGGLSASLGSSLAEGATTQVGTSQAPLSALQPSLGAVKGTTAAIDLASRAALIKASLGAIALGGAVAAYSIVEPLAPNPDVPSVPALVAPAADRPEPAVPPVPDEPVEPAASELRRPPDAGGKEMQARRQSEAKATTRSSSASGSTSSPVYAELASVRRAQAELTAGRPEQALALMEQLGRTSAGGSLLVERELTRVLALCALGRQAEARGAATRVDQLPGGAAYRTRLASSCVGQQPPDDAASDQEH